MASKQTKAKLVRAREKLIIHMLDDERVKIVMSDMVRHYEIIDIMRRTNKASVLKAIYFEKHQRGVVAMTCDFFVCDRTIDRYREEFIECFQAAMQLRGTIDEIAAAWNNFE